MRRSNWKSCSFLLVLMMATAAGAQVSWQQVPLSFDAAVRAFYVDSADTTLYISGNFNYTNSYYTGCIIRVRKDFSQVPLPPVQGGAGTCMLKWNGKLYFGGFAGLRVYDGQSWTTLDSESTVLCLYPYQGKLLIGGIFEPLGFGRDSTLKANIIEYNGSTFRAFKGVDSVIRHDNMVSAMTEYKGDLIVAGNIDPYPPIDPRFREILRWTGTRWDAVGNGIQGGGLNELYQLKVLNGRLYVAGYFTKATGGPGNSIAAWDGLQWDDLGGGFMNNGYVGGLESRGDTLYVSGYGFNIAGFTNAVHFGAYTGGKWCVNTVPADENAVFSKVVDFYGTLLVGGGIHQLAADTFGNLAQITGIGTFVSPLRVPVSGGEHPFHISVYPNPLSGDNILNFYSASTEELVLQVVDGVGRQCLRMPSRDLTGPNKYRFALPDVSSGIYFLQLSSAKATETIKLEKR